MYQSQKGIMTQFRGYLQDKLGRIPEEDEKPVIDTETVTYKIEEYEDRRILKIKACKNNEEEKEDTEEGNNEEKVYHFNHNSYINSNSNCHCVYI